MTDVRCPACQGPVDPAYQTYDYNQRLSDDAFRYFRCRRCKLIFLDPIPEDLGHYYSQSYYAIPGSVADLAQEAAKKQYQIDLVRQFVKDGRLLDIGPGHGAFAFLAKEAGYDVSTIEMDASCCQFLQEVVGVSTIQSDNPAAVLPQLELQDVITLWHVIEHLPDPWTTLKRVVERLAPGGILVIAAPNPQALQFRVFRERWVHLDAPRHVRLIPAPLLARRLVDEGLQPALVTANDRGGQTLNRYGWRASLINLSSRRLVRAAGWRLGAPLGMVAAPIEQSGLRGAAYTAVFRKPANTAIDDEKTEAGVPRVESDTWVDPALNEMYRCLKEGDAAYLPSRFWETLGDHHLEQLTSRGYDNFKRTLASNYFTWLISPRNNQFRFLARHTPPREWLGLLRQPFNRNSGLPLSRPHQMFLQLYTRMLWRYVERLDTERVLRKLSEPAAGNPFQIFLGGEVISQDLANSVMEYSAIREHFHRDYREAVTIAELGGGYGRNAYVFLSLFPNCRYIMIDIPPALYVAQRYLSNLFPDRRIADVRCSASAEEIAAQVQEADIAFLLPHQAAALPSKSVDLFLNISSLHEMQPDQITAYLKMIDRLTAGFFYSKQWMESRNPYDEIVVRSDDYPIPPHWREIYNRPAKVQTTFFEALYQIP